MKLLARNLARTSTESEINALFEAYGKVQYCSLAIDKETGNSKGFAFIEMPRPGDAKAAVKNLNGKVVAGNKIRVKRAETKKAAQTSSEEKLTGQKNTKTEKTATVSYQPEKNDTQQAELENDESKHDAPINPGIWSK